MVNGGDWKQFFRAAGEGSLWEITYHLDRDVDPNFQHPEFFSSALCEASRKGQPDAVELLLKRGADPSIREDLSGHLPLEIALDGQQHMVVDILLATMDKATISSIVQCIHLDTDDDSLVEAVARKGHYTIWKNGSKQSADLIRRRSGNHKLDVLPEAEQTHRPAHTAVLDNRFRAIDATKTGAFVPETRIICARPIADQRHTVVRRYAPYWWPSFLSFEPSFKDLVLASMFPEPPTSGIEF